MEEDRLIEELIALYQISTVNDYEEQFKKLAGKINGISEYKFVLIFERGLKDEIIPGVQPFRPTTLDQAIALAKFQEVTFALMEKQSKNPEITNCGDDNKQHLDYLESSTKEMALDKEEFENAVVEGEFSFGFETAVNMESDESMGAEESSEFGLTMGHQSVPVSISLLSPLFYHPSNQKRVVIRDFQIHGEEPVTIWTTGNSLILHDLYISKEKSIGIWDPGGISILISGYLSNERFDLAREVFQKMPHRDLVSWNMMISGYIRNRDLGAACLLFDQMPEKDVVSWNSILSGYAQNGYVDEARMIFDKMPNKNYISWNGILAAYVQNGRIEEARCLFESKSDWHVVSWNCLMGGYVRKKMLVDARHIIDTMPVRDEVSWNTMISGYTQNGYLSDAQLLFDETPVRDVFTWNAIISAYLQNGRVEEARRVFDPMTEKSSVSWNAMMAGYSQCKRTDLARQLIESMPCRNVSSWNTMITAFIIIEWSSCLHDAWFYMVWDPGGFSAFERSLYQILTVLRNSTMAGYAPYSPKGFEVRMFTLKSRCSLHCHFQLDWVFVCTDFGMLLGSFTPPCRPSSLDFSLEVKACDKERAMLRTCLLVGC